MISPDTESFVASLMHRIEFARPGSLVTSSAALFAGLLSFGALSSTQDLLGSDSTPARLAQNQTQYFVFGVGAQTAELTKTSELQERHRREKVELQERHRREKGELQERHRRETVELQERHRREKVELQEKQREDQHTLREKHRREASELREKHRREASSLREKHRREASELHEKHRREASELREKQRRETYALREKQRKASSIAATSPIESSVSQGSTLPRPAPLATKDCGAPRTAVRIPSPSCTQLWATHLFRQLGPPHFDQWSASIDQFERGALTAEMWIDRVTTIGGLLVSVFEGPNDALEAAKILYDVNGAILTLIPIENPVYEIGVEAVNTVRNGIKTAIIYSVRGTASPPYAEMVSLANKIAALWNTHRIIRERNTLTLVREYLRQLYSFGGDQGSLAEAHGLPRGTAMKDVLAAVNKKFGFIANPLSGNSYSPTKTEQAVAAWTGAVADLAEYKGKEAKR